jgi:hypothetical protein
VISQPVFRKTIDRNIVFIRMTKEVYNSPAPSSFLRVGSSLLHEKTSKPQDYMMVTLDFELGTGATGTAHTATLELPGSDGKTHTTDNAVVKLAFDDNQRERLRHELSIYEHLKGLNVRGVPMIIGLFQDLETSTLALIMNNVGTCVLSLEPPTDAPDFGIPEPQKYVFLLISSVSLAT